MFHQTNRSSEFPRLVETVGIILGLQSYWENSARDFRKLDVVGVAERCGFCEIESSCEMFQMLKEMQETFMTRTLSMLMETQRKELRDKDAAIGQLKAEIGILKTNNQW